MDTRMVGKTLIVFSLLFLSGCTMTEIMPALKDGGAFVGKGLFNRGTDKQSFSTNIKILGSVIKVFAEIDPQVEPLADDVVDPVKEDPIPKDVNVDGYNYLPEDTSAPDTIEVK